MPKSRPLAPRDPLAGLPRHDEAIILGDWRVIQAPFQDINPATPPRVMLWMEAPEGLMRGAEPIITGPQDSDAASRAVEILARGLVSAPGAPPLMPGKIVVADASLVPALTQRFAPYHVAIEVDPNVTNALNPFFDDLFTSLGLTAEGEAPPPFAWDLPQEVLVPLFDAASRYWRRKPWEYLLDHPTFAVTLGSQHFVDGVEIGPAAVLGAGGTVFGLSLYPTDAAYESSVQRGGDLKAYEDDRMDAMLDTLRQQGLPVDLLPPQLLRSMIGDLVDEEVGGSQTVDTKKQDAVVCWFDPEDEVDPSYLEWIQARGITPPAKNGIPSFWRAVPGEGIRPPTEREARALTLALEAVNQFCSKYRKQLIDGAAEGETLSLMAKVGDQKVPISFTPMSEESYLSRESPEARATLYRLRVTLWDPKVWRTIELRGSMTLYDLHMAIQSAFGWDNDHLYAFFLSGKAWDNSTEISGDPLGGGAANRQMIHSLGLTKNKTFLYIFDFGDELRHKIKVEAIVPDGVEATADYPRVVASAGQSLPQYPNYEDEEEDGDEDAGTFVEGNIIDIAPLLLPGSGKVIPFKGSPGQQPPPPPKPIKPGRPKKPKA